VDVGALAGYRDSQQEWLLGLGVRADSSAQVFNNNPEELKARFGLTARQATELLGGVYSSSVGVGQVGEEIVGEGSVGEGRVGPCTRGMSCYGNLHGHRIVGEPVMAPRAQPVAPSVRRSSPAPVRQPAPAPAAARAAARAAPQVPSAGQQQAQPSWQQRAGDLVNQAGRVVAPAASRAGGFIRGVGQGLWGVHNLLRGLSGSH